MKRFFYYTTLFLIAILLMQSCKKDNNEPNNEEEPTGVLSEKELKSLPVFTHEDYIVAYEAVLLVDPELTADEQRLARAIYRRLIQNNKNTSVKAYASTSSLAENLTLFSRVNWEEIKLAFTHPINTYIAFTKTKPAYEAATAKYACESDTDFDDSKTNAILHSYWNALMTKYVSESFAEQVGNAHESQSPSDASNTKMDLHNNKVGRKLAVKYPDAMDEELLGMLINSEFVFFDKNDEMPVFQEDYLVYFKSRQLYDGKLTGSMTNPDAGITWEITFYINQCGNTIRGNYIITNGTSMQKRRFSGVLTDTGMDLNVSLPYSFEGGAGNSNCRDVQINLLGNENQLAGKWSSSNCTRGGEVSIKR